MLDDEKHGLAVEKSTMNKLAALTQSRRFVQSQGINQYSGAQIQRSDRRSVDDHNQFEKQSGQRIGT